MRASRSKQEFEEFKRAKRRRSRSGEDLKIDIDIDDGDEYLSEKIIHGSPKADPRLGSKPRAPPRFWSSLTFKITVLTILGIATIVLVVLFCLPGSKNPDTQGVIKASPSSRAVTPPPTRSTSKLRAYYKTMQANHAAFTKQFANWSLLKGLANNAYNGKWSQRDLNKFADDAMNTRPILHEDMVPLLTQWLAHKQKNGSTIEKATYNKTVNGMKFDFVDLFDRLLKKRPAAFLNATDDHVLRDGSQLPGKQPFDVIGTANDTEGLLRDYMSYDEMLLASLMTVSCPTQLFNDGALDNNGKAGSFQPTAIYLGQVGSRFERAGSDLMEWRHMVADTARNYQQYPMLPLYEKFYGVDAGTMTGSNSLQSTTTCPVVQLKSGRKQQFKLSVLDARYRKSAEVHLAEAQFYGDRYNQDVRIYSVGLGTGCWAPKPSFVTGKRGHTCDALIIKSYINLIRERHVQYSRIKVVEFNYFQMKNAFDANRHMFPSYKGTLTQEPDGRLSFVDSVSNVTFVFHGDNYKRSDGKARSSPFVPGPQLIVANFAWDCNSFPGNEYWLGDLSASGDPAAACCSTIWNHMNPALNGRFMSGDNSWVMLKQGGFKRLVDYRTEASA